MSFQTNAAGMNFSWLEDERIAGCRGPRTDGDLAFLSSVGVKALVRLAYESETGISETDVSTRGLVDCYEPVEDFTAPSAAQIERVIGFIDDALQGGSPVAVSCGAGCGRTGTILACYLVSRGNSSERAIGELLSKRPCCEELLQTPGQREAVEAFAASLKARRTK